MWSMDGHEQKLPAIYNLKTILGDASKNQYAVGSFSPRYTKMIAPVIRAAMDVNSPAIIQLSEKEIIRHKVSLKEFSDEFHAQLARLHPRIPLVLHLDHTFTFDIIRQAIDNKFTSVMIDASGLPFEENVRITRDVVDYAHPFGVTVEAELGTIGTTDFVETDIGSQLFTDPEEAGLFCRLTGIDALAVSIGTAHGMYTTTQPVIDFERLVAINAATDIPLVLHGASGVPADMLVKAVSMRSGGVSKVNIATDLEQAMLKVIGEKTHITEEKLNCYDEITLQRAQEAVQALVVDKMRHYLLSENKALS